jgi:hypothetical protein
MTSQFIQPIRKNKPTEKQFQLYYITIIKHNLYYWIQHQFIKWA